MREIYPSCLINIDNCKSISQIIRSLRYSTHCEYYLQENYNLDLNDFPHFHFIINQSEFEKKPESKTFYINCINNDFVFGHKKFERKAFEFAKLGLQKMIDSNIEFLKEGVFNLTKGFDNNLSGELVFLIDFEAKCNPIIAHIEYEKEKYYSSFVLQEIFKEFCNQISNNNLSDCIFSINININKNKFEYINHISRYNESWEIYRALGINIPLIVIQNLLLRKITTHIFITPESIAFSKDGLPYYNFNPTKYYFDLDETLICRGKLIQDIARFLILLSKQRKKIVMLTRHIYDIKTTLISIGIDPNIFTDIIKVEANQKKSDFIKIDSNSIFIDNEFPERYEVWINCGINVLDIDQIDFIKINS